MSKDLSEYMAAAAAAYHDGRRNAVEQAIGTLTRVPMSEAIKAYVERLAKNRERKHGANPAGHNSHSYNTGRVLAKLARDMGFEYLDEITRERVSAWMDASSLAAKTLRGYKSCLDGLCTFARQRGWLSSDPLEILDSPSLPPGEIQYVKAEDLPHALECIFERPSELPVAMAALGGIRRCESPRMAPTDVLWKERHFLIRPEVSKTGRKRFVPMSDRLAEIVERCGQRFGPVLCAAPRSKQAWHPPALTISAQRSLKKSGIKTEPSRIPLVKAGIFNTLRHTAITYWLKTKNHKGDWNQPYEVAGWAGNSLEVIQKHYGAHIPTPMAADDADFLKNVKQAK